SCGNVATCVQTITLTDVTPPTITCPVDVTIDCGESTDPTNTGDATATDNCSGVTISYTDNSSGGCTQTITRTWMAEDSCGNVATCIQTITQVDNSPPTITCPSDVTLSCGDSTDPTNTGEPTAMDDCSGVIVTYTDVSTGTCPEILTRTWTAEDSCGNVATCEQVITINDDTPPTITCPANVTIDCGDPTDPTNTGEATATDDCSGVIISYTDASSGSGCTETITRTWMAEDSCGNIATCVQTITQQDNTPPTITCPPDVVLDCSVSTDPNITGEPTVTDDCASVSVTYSDASNGLCPEVISRTWTAEDSCGNIATCVQTITREDNTPPTIMCPADVTIDCGDPTDPTNTGVATASDNCAGVTVTYSDSPLAGCSEGVERTWTAEDSCGNITTCVQIITVDDNTPPTITCPADVTLACGDSTDPANTGEATGFDSCSIVTITYSDASNGMCPEVITRTWMAEDSCGNVASCVQTISIEDDGPPTITCPADVTVSCGVPIDPSNTGEATASDGCSGVNITYSDQIVGGCNQTITRTWMAEDSCGNVVTCEQTISRVDDSGPMITCPADVTISCGESTDPSNTGEATATDDCSSVTLSYTDNTTGGCSQTITRTWTAEDSCGNSSTCVQVIQVVDDQGPVLTCPADVTVNCGDPTDPSNTGEATATDSCSTVSITHSDAVSGTCPETITRTWTAEDTCGNVSTCVQTISVVDDLPPTITCPADVTVNCGDPTDPNNTGEATATDDCSGVLVSYSDAITGSCPEIITRTWTAEDSCGNIASCVQTITQVDNQPPTIMCPADVTINCGDPTDPGNTGAAVVTDDCLGASVTYSDVSQGGCNQTITRTWIAEDSCGNIATCEQIITLIDNGAPSITCPADVTINCGDSTDPANTGEPTASDSCSSVMLSYTDSSSGSCPEIITRTWTAEDSCGNASSCVQTITVEDNEVPTITCPANVTINCGDPSNPLNTGFATGSDNCSSPIVTYSDSYSGSCPEILTRTWSAEDSCGNVATCVQTITIQDVGGPTLVCPIDITITCGESRDPVNTGEATASDDCSGVSLTYSDATTGVCPEVLTRTWTAVDSCGNIATCQQIITVDDTTAPVITCPVDLTLQCGPGLDTSTNNTGWPTVSDSCSGVTVTFADAVTGFCPEIITRTFTAEDSCGNISTCEQIITVDDTIPPSITCPPDVTVFCREEHDLKLTGEPTVTDNCNYPINVNYRDSLLHGECPGVLQRTWRATDACGNRATCIQIITIEQPSQPLKGGEHTDKEQPSLIVMTNDPNPWSTQTTIGFIMPYAGEMKFSLLDANGKLEYSQTEYYPEGSHEIIIEATQIQSAGIKYFIMETEKDRIIRRMIYIE
ncbi:MAG: hypothetical protein R3275_09765, partial [Saprospiraceae bacterium]|nr:hypothetical protein [Saprospiraceae bacterium]